MMNLLEEAIIYSTIMYQGKTRKISSTPFILHPLEVAQILSVLTDDMEIIAAGVLHEIVEGTDGTLAEIKNRFGSRVAGLVDSVTEEVFQDEDKAATWKKRKAKSLGVLSRTRDKAVQMLWLADKLSSIRALASSYGELGEKVWDQLHQKDPEAQLWYFRSVAEYVEMDLNKTGAYKEYVDRINYIWPGTFESWKSRYKEFREVSVDGCQQIGKGAKGDVFRYDDELIVKVYNEKNTFKEVEQEINLTRTAFVMGLPTAISFGIVSVGASYGALFELINAKTLSELIAKNPEHVEYYAEIMADLARLIHDTDAEDSKLFPDAAIRLDEWVDRALENEEEELAQRVRTLVRSVPATTHLVHGDFHTGNVFLQNGEPLFIDVDRMSKGNPIMDISGLYLFYVGFDEVFPGRIEAFMGFTRETAETFYNAFMRRYLQTEDEEIIQEATQKAAFMAYVRLIGQIKKAAVLSDHDREVIHVLLEKIRSLSTLPTIAI